MLKLQGRAARRQMRVTGRPARTAAEALEWARLLGRKAILVNGGYLVLAESEAFRLAAAGASFAYLGRIERGQHAGRIVTIPIN